MFTTEVLNFLLTFNVFAWFVGFCSDGYFINHHLIIVVKSEFKVINACEHELCVSMAMHLVTREHLKVIRILKSEVVE